MAGLMRARQEGYVRHDEVGIIDSTAHMIKFLTFQDMYLNDGFGPEFNVKPRSELRNTPSVVRPKKIKRYPEPGKSLQGEDMEQFIREMASEIAQILDLSKVNKK